MARSLPLEFEQFSKFYSFIYFNSKNVTRQHKIRYINNAKMAKFKAYEVADNNANGPLVANMLNYTHKNVIAE